MQWYKIYSVLLHTGECHSILLLHSWKIELSIRHHVTEINQLHDLNLTRYYIIWNNLPCIFHHICCQSEERTLNYYWIYCYGPIEDLEEDIFYSCTSHTNLLEKHSLVFFNHNLRIFGVFSTSNLFTFYTEFINCRIFRAWFSRELVFLKATRDLPLWLVFPLSNHLI